MNNQIIINLKEDGTIKNIETTKEQELQSIIKFKEDCLNEYADRINKAIDYIENNDLYTQDINYDYDDNMVLSPPTDELERKELLNILRGEDNE